MRKIKLWVGKTDDTNPPPNVRLRVFDKYKGRCHRSNAKINIGDKWELDHIIALCNGGENKEENLAPILVEQHKQKTKEDVAIKTKTNRIRKKHLGIDQGKTKNRYSRRYDKARKEWRFLVLP